MGFASKDSYHQEGGNHKRTSTLTTVPTGDYLSTTKRVDGCSLRHWIPNNGVREQYDSKDSTIPPFHSFLVVGNHVSVSLHTDP